MWRPTLWSWRARARRMASQSCGRSTIWMRGSWRGRRRRFCRIARSTSGCMSTAKSTSPMAWPAGDRGGSRRPGATARRRGRDDAAATVADRLHGAGASGAVVGGVPCRRGVSRDRRSRMDRIANSTRACLRSTGVSLLVSKAPGVPIARHGVRAPGIPSLSGSNHQAQSLASLYGRTRQAAPDREPQPGKRVAEPRA